MSKANLQAGIPTSVFREAATGVVMQWDIIPEITSKKPLSVDETLLSGDGQASFCSENSIAWCWFQVMQRHLLL